MSKGGIILRLIDVVLILLFGFISISEISRQTQIELPKCKDIPLSNPDKEAILIVGITEDGRYLVEDETQYTTNTKVLMRYIEDKRKEFHKKNTKMKVRIRSNYNAPVRYAIKLACICDLLKIPKSVDVQQKGS